MPTDAQLARTKRAVVACMRNEAAFLPEWVAYHLSIGFDRIFLITNGCQDGTDDIADRLAMFEPLVHIRNPVQPGQSPQTVGLPLALQHPQMADVEWLLHIDADEFLNITTGAGRVDDLIDAAGECDAIAISWRYMASGGRKEWTGGLVTEQTFSRASSEDHLDFHKTMFRPNRFGRITCHMPKQPADHRAVVHNAAGQRLPNRSLYNDEDNVYRGVKGNLCSWVNADIHHYFVRAKDVFMLKNVRGDGMAFKHSHHTLGSKLWKHAERAMVEDRSILRHLPVLRERLARYEADAVLKPLMARALDWIAGQRQAHFTAENLSQWDPRNLLNKTFDHS